MPKTHCPDCKYYIEYDWLPCTNCPSEGEKSGYPPLPLSDDEDEGGNLYFFDTKGEPSVCEDYVNKVGGDFKPRWSHVKVGTKFGVNVAWDSCWDDYSKLIGVLGNFPYVIQEAQLLYRILQEKWRTREELVVAALDLSGTQLFARSITAIDWHLEKMEEATLIYRITSYE